MGFDVNGIRLLINAKALNVNFEKVMTIGRQGMHLSPEKYSALLKKSLLGESSLEQYSESFLKLLGAQTVHSLDASEHDGATLIHDLNKPIPEEYKEQYSLVIDGGSLEHVFDFPTAVKSCMEMIALGGYYIGITPTNNFLGHGFYQFSPELYFRIFSEMNGFELVKTYLYIDERSGSTPIFEVVDPNAVRSRVIMQNAKPSYLFVVAKRVEKAEIFSQAPQQSDYQNMVWKGDKGKQGATSGKTYAAKKGLWSKLSRSYKKRTDLFFSPTGLCDSDFIYPAREDIVEL